LNPVIVVLIVTAVMAVFLTSLLVASVVKRYREQKILEDFKKRKAAQDAKRERQRFFLKEESALAEDSAQAAVIGKLRKRYDSARKVLKIPPESALVWRKVDIFCLKNCEILHYCWCSNVNLYLFPKWVSIESHLVSGGAGGYIPGDESRFSAVTIPINAIEQWVQLPDKSIGFVYKKRKRGKLEKMRLESAAYMVFQKMPEKEHGYVMKNVYPRSSRQIRAVRNEYRNLKTALKKGEITNEQFYELKMKIILNM